MDGVDQMYAPIGHRAARVIPEITKGRERRHAHAPTVEVEGDFRCGPEPHIPIEPFGNRPVRGFAPALLLGQAALPGMTKRHFADHPALNDFSRLLEIATGTLHRTRLND